MRKRSAKSVLKRVNFKNFEKISDAFTDGSDLVSASKGPTDGRDAAPRMALDAMRPVSKGNRDHAYRQHAAAAPQILNGGIIVSPCEVESWTKALY